MRTIRTALFWITLAPAGLWAGESGERALGFLTLDASARAAAMGGAHSALARGASALHYNPAGLGGVQEATFMHNQYFQGMTQDYAAAAFKSGWGASVHYLDYGPVDRTTISSKDGNLGQAGGSEMALSLGYGRRPLKSLGVGAAAKFIRGSLDLVTANSYALDLGTLYSPELFPGMTWGFTIQNIGVEARYQSAREKLPLSYRGGAALSFGNDLYTGNFVLDIVHRPHREAIVGVGAEVLVAKMMSVRFGYSNRSNTGLGLTGGLGWLYRNYRLDYAMVPFGSLGFSHRVGLSVSWGDGGEEPVKKGAASTPQEVISPPEETKTAAVPPVLVRPKPVLPKIAQVVESAEEEENAEEDSEEAGQSPLDMRYFSKRPPAPEARPVPSSSVKRTEIVREARPPVPAVIISAPITEPAARKISPPKPQASSMAETLDMLLRHPAGTREREEALQGMTGRINDLKAVKALAVQAITTVLRDETRSTEIMTLALRLIASLEDKASAPIVRNFLFNGRPEVVAEAALALAALSDKESIVPLEDLVSQLDKDPRFDAARSPRARSSAEAVRAALQDLKPKKPAPAMTPASASPTAIQKSELPAPKKSGRRRKPPKKRP